MSDPSDVEARLAALEARMEEVAADAAAARHLAAAGDRDLADLAVKVDANRQAVNALGLRTAGRFDRLERRFDGLEQRFDGLEHRVDGLETKVDNGFAEMRGKFDQTAAGMQRITDLLTTLLDRGDAWPVESRGERRRTRVRTSAPPARPPQRPRTAARRG